MGTEDETKPTIPETHPKGFYFLFAGEFAERFSFYGMRVILPLYLADHLGYGQARANQLYFLFVGLCYFLPLLGGWIADNLLGKYWTIVLFSVPYVIGQCLVGLENDYVLVLALLLLAMGTGVIKPNISTLLGITYDQKRPGQEKLRSNAFQYFYLAINIGAAMSQLLVPIVRDQTGSYLSAFLVPAVFMVVALSIFAAGKNFYGVETLDQKPVVGPTRSSAEETVAKLQVLGQVGLLFLLVTFFWAVFDQSSSTWVFFAKTYMDRRILGIELAPDSIQALNPIFIVVFIGLTMLYRTFSTGSTTGKPTPATTKMFIGFLLTALCMGVMAVAGFLTGKPSDALVIKTKELELSFPLGTASLNGGTIDFTKKEDNLTNSGGTVECKGEKGPVLLTFKGYNSVDASKFTFSDGILTLADGKTIEFAAGRIDYSKSTAFNALKLPGTDTETKFAPEGALDTQFKKGKYQFPDGVLVVKRANQTEFLSGEKLKIKPNEKEKGTVSVGKGEYLKPEDRVSVWWMALAFLVITVAEILISVTGLELAFVVAPANMKGFVTACWLLTVAMANWFINAPISELYETLSPGKYFTVLTGMGLLVAILFIPVSRKFNRALQAAKEREASLEGNSVVD